MQIKKLLHLLFIFLFCIKAYSIEVNSNRNTMGYPFVHYYHPLEYKGYSQNWYISNNQDGIMYFANGDGILEYDGHEWNMHKIDNNFTPFSILIDKNIIWVGAKEDFGYFVINNKNKEYEYKSLKFLLPEQIKQELGIISKIFKKGNSIYFSSFNYSFILNKDKIKIIKHLYPSSIFDINNNLVLYQFGKGMSLFNNGNKIKIEGGDFFKDKNIRFILKYEKNKNLIITQNK
jgi:hypothetical protein